MTDLDSGSAHQVARNGVSTGSADRLRFPTGHGLRSIQNVVHLGSVTSTNEVAKAFVERMVSEDSELCPTALLSCRQSAGRGRAGRTWASLGDTSLALSLVVPWPEGPDRILLPLRTGIVLARGLSKRFGIDVRLKWPNDLLVGRKKLAGLLIETRSGGEDASYAVIGFGLNVTTSRAALDEAGLPDATSLAIERAAEGSRPGFGSGSDLAAAAETVLQILDEGLHEEIADLPAAFAEVTAHKPGDHLVVRDGAKRTEGDYVGVTPQGMLRLGTPGGVETLVSGDVTSF